jgi:hypothetical protein
MQHVVIGSKWLAHSGSPCQFREGLDENIACADFWGEEDQ